MKVTLDLDKLLHEGLITQDEYKKFSALAAKSTGTLAFNLLIGFGVIAVSGAAFALIPAPTTAIVIGLLALVMGLVLLRSGLAQWGLLANIFVLVGALMSGGGIVGAAAGSLLSILVVTLLFAAAGIFARSTLLVVLATLTLSAAVGARTGYFHASYFLVIQEPLITIILFSFLGISLYLSSKSLSPELERLAIASARTSVFLVNFGFWVGSLWGDSADTHRVLITDAMFSILWMLALIVTAIWSWQSNRRWVLNTVATFAGIHFYTQWFEYLGDSPGAVLIAGLLALLFAVVLSTLNNIMKEKT